ncbi:ATP-dependent helicase [Gordonibacter sp. An230]|uniref:PD-(D/E)XK nuclease family protein n=1 Tax=Gordonibacter sp. An230 TaxID=1965592 RepID=UPI000B3A40A5|nr:PD-(D/E)XK nuclease family protein [Gordonibacter sp. An230]OUO90877.1 ATP-dependent helicase [Gordonibacter sp. An230]
MPFRSHIFDNADAALDAARSLLSEFGETGEDPTLLVPTSAAALRVRCALADDADAFGARVETPESWIADRWELFGDGRRLVDGVERELLVRRALAEGSSDVLCPEPTPGMIDLASALAREALPGIVSVGGAEAQRLVLGDAERALVDALSRYAGLLGERGLAEASQAAWELPALLPARPLVLLGFDEVPCYLKVLSEALSVRTVVARFDDGCRAPFADARRAPELTSLVGRLYKADADPVEPTGAVRFLVPAGRYAAPALVLDELLDAIAREREAAARQERDPLPAVVCARDPLGLFDELADALGEKGASVAVVATRPFSQTAFGRAFGALVSLVIGKGRLVERATDFALGAFSGMSIDAAGRLDAAWRGDRTVDAARLIRDLSAASSVASDALEALSRKDADGALRALEEGAREAGGLDAASRAEALAAAARARRFVDACDMVGTDALPALPLLERAPCPASAQTPLQGAVASPDAMFMSLSDAAELPMCSVSALFICDLTSKAYPVRVEEDTGTLLLERLGLARPVDPLAAARRRFFRALCAARSEVVCERELSTQDAAEAYPAVMLEELLDCYRDASVGPAEDVDRTTSLPVRLVPFARTAGEDALHENLALVSADVLALGAGEEWDLPRVGEVVRRDRVALPRRASEGSPAIDLDEGRIVLSPSALEAYLECPCKWFASRRLRLSELDAGFGPLERGSFSHSVLKSFYERFREAGGRRVSSENVEAARVLLSETFEQLLAIQPELERSFNPLVPRTAVERAEVRELKRTLLSYLDRECGLLPGFVPERFEFEFGGHAAFSYGGCLLRGSVDRIDVNDRGQAVVIDYKGSLSRDHALAAASPVAQAAGALLPHRVQALVYAQVARRALGLDVVGALYVSYGRNGGVSGAFDRTVLGPVDLPGIDEEGCGAPGPACEAMGAASFSELVDAVEEGIACAVRSLSQGVIDPDPRGGDPCGFCPVPACERRRDA